MGFASYTLFRAYCETGSMGGAAQDLDIGVSARVNRCPVWKRKTLSASAAAHLAHGGNANQRRAGLFIHRRNSPCVMPTTRFSPPEGSAPFRSCERRNGPSTASILGIPFYPVPMQENYADVRLHVVLESLSGNLERMINTRQIDLAVVFQKIKSCAGAPDRSLKNSFF